MSGVRASKGRHRVFAWSAAVVVIAGQATGISAQAQQAIREAAVPVALEGSLSAGEPVQPVQARPPAVPARRPPIGFRAYAWSDATEMAAADTFDATLGTTRMTGLGGGGEVLRLWRGVFARAGISTSSAAGERVVVFEREAIPLGIPMHVRLTPLEIGGGWRTDFGRQRAVGVYGGGALIRMHFEQTSDFAQSGEDIDQTTSGFAAFGGVDYTIARWIVIGAEGQYRSIPNAIGQDGASKAFGENDLGGLTFRVVFGIRR